MALTERSVSPQLAPILEEVARGFGRHGMKESAESTKGILRIEREENVRRIIQAYWTPFEANVPGESIGLHLEVAEPTVHWAEAYLSPTYRNWVFSFAERSDGEIQLTQYRDLATYQEAIDEFFNLASWYVLTATDLTWSDVGYRVADDLEFGAYHRGVAGAGTSGAIQESLKKSTIIWLRFKHDGREVTMPVWFLYDQKADKIYVLSGERQQTIPGAERLRDVDVILRWKGKNARVAEIPASVHVLPQGPEWDEVAEKIAEKRLNIPGMPEETARRWREECVILELILQS